MDFATKIVTDEMAKNAKLICDNRKLEDEVKRLTLENATLRTLLKEAKEALERRGDLQERIDALEARINDDKEKQAKLAQAYANWAESLTKVTINSNKKD